MDELGELVKILIDASGVGFMCLFIGWYRTSLDNLRPSLRIAGWSVIAAALTAGVMLTAFQRGDGLVIDLRSTVICMAVFLGGWLPGLAAALAAAAMRIHMGGSFMAYGLIGIGMTFALSTAVLYGLYGRPRELSFGRAVLLAVIVTWAGLSAPYIELDWQAVLQSWRGYAAVEGLAVFASVIIVSAIINKADMARRNRDTLALRERELSEKNRELGQLTDDLRHAHAEMRAIMDHTVDGLITVDEGGTILTFSKPAEDMFGYEADEVIGHNLGMLMPQPMGEEVSALLRAHPPLATLDLAAASRELAGRAKDGSEFPMDLAVGSIVDGAGKFVVTVRNISERKLTEAQLLQARKMEAVGHLAAGLAHDFNNILAAVHGFATLLVEDLEAQPTQSQYAKRILAACQRAKDLVQQIVTISRKADVERRLYNLADVLTDVLSVFRGTLPKSVHLEVHVEDGEQPVVINRPQVYQIITNLVLNARDAVGTQEAYIRVSLTTAAADDPVFARIRSLNPSDDGHLVFEPGCAAWGRLDPEASYAKLTVSDDGIGISDELMRNIFDPFYTTKVRARGTGLGLAFVLGALLEQKGIGLVESSPGEGASFTLLFPLARSAAALAGGDGRPLEGKERVLIVDDESDITDALNLSLSKLGYDVLAVGTAEDAIAILEADPDAWDIIASDLTMPGLSGLDLYRRVESLKAPARFILCSGYFDAEVEAAAARAGVDALLEKPVSAERLSAVIRQLLDESETV